MVPAVCQNLFMSTGQYCGAPALELEGYRNLCLPCHLRARASTERTVREYLPGVDLTAWLERSEQHLTGLRDWTDHLLLIHAPLFRIIRARADIALCEHLTEIVRGMV